MHLEKLPGMVQGFLPQLGGGLRVRLRVGFAGQ